MNETSNHSQLAKSIAFWAGFLALVAIGVMAYRNYFNRQVEAVDVAARVRPLIAMHWRDDAAMKFAHIQGVTLRHGQPGRYHGEIVYKFGEYESTWTLNVLEKADHTFDWSVNAPNNMPMQVETVIASQVFFEYPVTDEEAGKFVGWLLAEGHIGEEPGSYFLRKEGPTFVFHLAAKDGLNDELEKSATDIARRLPAEVFNGASVEVHLCDRELRTLKVVGGR